MRLRQNFRLHVGREEDDQEDDDENDEVHCYNDFCFTLDSFWEPKIEDFEVQKGRFWGSKNAWFWKSKLRGFWRSSPRPFLRDVVSEMHVFEKPVLAMNGKRVTKKRLWMQAKALIRKLQIMKR